MEPDMRYLGVGLYTASDVARIIGESPRKVRRWANGYRSHTPGGSHASQPLLSHRIPELAEDGVITFLELVELRLVAMFRQRKVSMPTIRAASRAAARLLGTPHPFAAEGFRTDVRNRIFLESRLIQADAEPGTEKMILHELPQCQLVMAELAEPFLLKLDYEEGIARQLWPLGRDRRVVIDPQRSFGKPIVHPESVPTYVLHAMEQAGESLETISWWYRVHMQAVRDAVEYEVSLAA